MVENMLAAKARAVNNLVIAHTVRYAIFLNFENAYYCYLLDVNINH